LFIPRLEILPPAQRSLWRELTATPRSFVLYGGTALALRLGHRRSEDFDFFSTEAFNAKSLLAEFPYLANATVVQLSENTLTCVVERQERVQVSFFGGLDLHRIHEPDTSLENGIRVASLLDLAGCKAGVVQQRAEAKDYIDIAALIRAGVDLPTVLAAGRAVYGQKFNPMITLRALSSFDEGNLGRVDIAIQSQLRLAVSMVKLESLPILIGRPGVCGPEESGKQ
jgi:hypothetical protein